MTWPWLVWRYPDDDIDPPIVAGTCAAIGGFWESPHLAKEQPCSREAVGSWRGLRLCFAHLREKREKER